MAEIIQNEGGKKKGKVRAKKHTTHIDMTPMVDLACLLLTFFMLTTAFSKPKVMSIFLPPKPKKDEKVTEIPKDRTVNIILDRGDKVYWYNGVANSQQGTLPALVPSDYSKDGIRKMLLQRNRELFKKIEEFKKTSLNKMHTDTLAKRIVDMRKDDKTGPIVLIKASESVKYGNIVDILDEMAICNIGRYALVDLSPDEKKMLDAARSANQ